jgi:trans-aconitate methyltransferase
MTDTSKPQAMEPSGVTGRIFACLMERMNEKAYRWTADMLGRSAPRHLHEIGFGTGRFLELAATRLPLVRMTGVDPSELMVSRARERLARKQPSLAVDLRHGTDASDFWPGETIDACVALHSFQFWQKPDETLHRLRDRLQEKGLLVLVLRRHGRNPPAWLPNPVSRSAEEIPETRRLLEKTGFSLVADGALDSASWGLVTTPR